MKLSRPEVYILIDGERAYQDSRWNVDTTPSGGHHSLAEWLVYIEDYVNEAKHIAARESDETANPKVSGIMRKIAAMAICAMEQHGAPPRA